MTKLTNHVVQSIYGVSLLDAVAVAMMPSVAILHADHIKERAQEGGNGGLHEITANIAFTYAEAFLKVRAERQPE